MPSQHLPGSVTSVSECVLFSAGDGRIRLRFCSESRAKGTALRGSSRPVMSEEALEHKCGNAAQQKAQHPLDH
jgi:hypothetical protein